MDSTTIDRNVFKRAALGCTKWNGKISVANSIRHPYTNINNATSPRQCTRGILFSSYREQAMVQSITLPVEYELLDIVISDYNPGFAGFDQKTKFWRYQLNIESTAITDFVEENAKEGTNWKFTHDNYIPRSQLYDLKYRPSPTYSENPLRDNEGNYCYPNSSPGGVFGKCRWENTYKASCGVMPYENLYIVSVTTPSPINPMFYSKGLYETWHTSFNPYIFPPDDQPPSPPPTEVPVTIYYYPKD